MTGVLDVVTGGAGFIGSHICEELLRRGGRVRVVDDLSTGKREHLSRLEQMFPDRCRLFVEDIRDQERLKRILEGAESVYHQAAVTSVEQSVRDPRAAQAVNLDGTLSVLLAARESGVRKVVFASSTAVYGNSGELPKRESMAPAPLSPYAVTKLCGELYCRVFSQLSDLPTICLRYFNVFGPRQDPESDYAAVIPRFITRMLSGKAPCIYGDGGQSRDFVFVDDVVRANLLAAESSVEGVSLNVASGARFTINQLVQVLNEILGTDFEPMYLEGRLGEVRHSEADVSLAQETLGFTSQVVFAEGLSRTVEWFQRGKECQT